MENQNQPSLELARLAKLGTRVTVEFRDFYRHEFSADQWRRILGAAASLNRKLLEHQSGTLANDSSFEKAKLAAVEMARELGLARFAEFLANLNPDVGFPRERIAAEYPANAERLVAVADTLCGRTSELAIAYATSADLEAAFKALNEVMHQVWGMMRDFAVGGPYILAPELVPSLKSAAFMYGHSGHVEELFSKITGSEGL